MAKQAKIENLQTPEDVASKRKQDIFVQGMKELGWPDFYVPNATFYLWMPIPPRYATSKEFTDDLGREIVV